GSSRLSAYLHFGQIPAAEVARAAMAAGPPAQVEAFISELVVWRSSPSSKLRAPGGVCGAFSALG
ncbi:MAG TPA: hypothetical protein VFP70_13375, partial [Burkholderiales bacterium]|nr:hypothetical protein [Burkholderiales bacterium]